MPAQNLWGYLGDIATTRTPALILQEQAGLLGKLTNEALEGEVRRGPGANPKVLFLALYIVAPALQRYRLKVLDLRYSYADVYPVRVDDSINDISYTADDEADFVDILRGILSSEKVQRAIANLISESQIAFPN